jgi:hypothetical protein
MGIIRPVEILSLLADEQVDVVGKVLGQGKTLESVCNEVFLQGEKVPERCMEGNRLPGEPPHPVDDHLVGYVIDPGKGPDPCAALGEMGKELVVGKMVFHAVIEGEGLG